MFRGTLLIMELWGWGTSVLLLMSLSRWIWDSPPTEGTRHGLFASRVFVSLFWWLMILSAGGRKSISHIMKGND